MAHDGEVVHQEMTTMVVNLSTGQSRIVQKRIQAILVKRRLWPQKGEQLECEKLKCITCQTLAICGICVQGQKCKFCKEVKNCSGKNTKQRICDACFFQKKTLPMCY